MPFASAAVTWYRLRITTKVRDSALQLWPTRQLGRIPKCNPQVVPYLRGAPFKITGSRHEMSARLGHAGYTFAAVSGHRRLQRFAVLRKSSREANDCSGETQTASLGRTLLWRHEGLGLWEIWLRGLNPHAVRGFPLIGVIRNHLVFIVVSFPLNSETPEAKKKQSSTALGGDGRSLNASRDAPHARYGNVT